MIRWDVEEYKIWKGIDKENPCWASLQFSCSSYDDAKGLMDYMVGNNKKLIVRVVKRETLSRRGGL